MTFFYKIQNVEIIAFIVIFFKINDKEGTAQIGLCFNNLSHRGYCINW